MKITLLLDKSGTRLIKKGRVDNTITVINRVIIKPSGVIERNEAVLIPLHQKALDIQLESSRLGYPKRDIISNFAEKIFN